MKKSFYIYVNAAFSILFICICAAMFNIPMTSLSYSADFASKFGNGFLNSTYFALFLSGAFVSQISSFVLNVICMLFSAYFVYLILKKSVTSDFALLFSGIYLSFTVKAASSMPYVCMTAFFTSLLLYLYVIKYDGVLKWYLAQIIIAVLALHYKVFGILLFVFPLDAFFRIKSYKTSWTAFVNALVMVVLSFVLYYAFVKGFPLEMPILNTETFKEFFTVLNVEKITAAVLFAFTLIASFYCTGLTKCYVMYGIAAYFMYFISCCMVGSDILSYVTFLPVTFVSAVSVLCHLRFFRKYKTVMTFICAFLGIASFLLNVII